MICSKLDIDPLRLIGSGSLLISCSSFDAPVVINRLKWAGIRCEEIGRFHNASTGRWLVSKGKKVELKEKSVQDELWRALREYGDLS